MKVIVCGSSRYQDRMALFAALDALHEATPLTLIINGGARGADHLASAWARARGVALKVYRATSGQAGGRQEFFDLNGRMIAEQQPDLILACAGGAVTADLIARAEAAGIRVVPVA